MAENELQLTPLTEVTFQISPMTKDCLEEVTKLHIQAFYDHLNVLLGKKYISEFLAWFLKNENTVHLVAKGEKGEILGYVVGAIWGYQKKLNRDLFFIAMAAIFCRPWVLLNRRILHSLWLRFAVTTGLNDHIRKTQKDFQGKIISLVGIAVAEGAKGTGIATCLIHQFEEQATALNFNVLRLSVYDSNRQAKRFYEKSGWSHIPGEINFGVCAYYKLTG